MPPHILAGGRAVVCQEGMPVDYARVLGIMEQRRTTASEEATLALILEG